MEKVYPKMRSKRVPNASRRPLKRPPLKRRTSFTDQYTYHIDDDDPPGKQAEGTSLIDQQTVDRMKICQRWPVPEMLLSRPDRYKLKVDSLMAEVFTVEYAREGAKYRQEIDAPLNSMSSGDEPDLYATDTEDEKKKALTKEDMDDPELARKAFDKSLLNTQPFRIESLRFFPYRQREGSLPLRLLKVPDLDFFPKSQAVLAE